MFYWDINRKKTVVGYLGGLVCKLRTRLYRLGVSKLYLVVLYPFTFSYLFWVKDQPVLVIILWDSLNLPRSLKTTLNNCIMDEKNVIWCDTKDKSESITPARLLNLKFQAIIVTYEHYMLVYRFYIFFVSYE